MDLKINSEIEYLWMTEKPTQSTQFELTSLLGNPTDKIKSVLSPREKMIQAINQAWKSKIDSDDHQWIIRLWLAILKDVDVLSWTAIEDKNEYVLELNNELIGYFPSIIGFKVIIKPKMVVHFKEEKINQTDELQRVIDFPEGGLIGRLGFGWLSKDFAVERILIHRAPDQKTPRFKVVCRLGSKEKEARRALELWEGVRWSQS